MPWNSRSLKSAWQLFIHGWMHLMINRWLKVQVQDLTFPQHGMYRGHPPGRRSSLQDHPGHGGICQVFQVYPLQCVMAVAYLVASSPGNLPTCHLLLLLPTTFLLRSPTSMLGTLTSLHMPMSVSLASKVLGHDGPTILSLRAPPRGLSMIRWLACGSCQTTHDTMAPYLSQLDNLAFRQGKETEPWGLRCWMWHGETWTVRWDIC